MIFARHWHESATCACVPASVHEFPMLNAPPTSFQTPSLWVIPEHQLWVPCFMHQTCTSHLFYIWWYTCFNAILSNHPTLTFSHRVQVCSLHLCLSCCLAYRVIVTIFLNSIYIHSYLVIFIWKWKCYVIQLCLTLCIPVDCNPPGSSVMKFSSQEY